MTAALTRGGRAALAATAVFLLGAAGLVADGGGEARAAGGTVVLDEGAFDLTPARVDGKLELKAAGQEPSAVVVHAVQSTLQPTPNPIAVTLGTTDLDTWQLNGWAAADLFAPEPGWKGTEAGGDTEVELAKYEGPGDFGMATYTREMDWSDEPPQIHLGSPAGAPRSFTLPADAERLAPLWMFSAEGVYRLTFTVTSGGSSDTETLAVVVGDDVDPEDVVPGDGTVPTSPPPSSAPPSSSPTAPAARVIDDGHLDLAARPVDGKLEFQVKQGTAANPAWYRPGEVVLHVKPAARRKIAAGYEFLGTVGDPVWWLPSSQVSGLVWPGWSTEEYTAADVPGDISFRLDAVQGPGAVTMFNTASLGALDLRFNSGDGLPDTYTLGARRHSHYVWTFAEEGVYRTTFTVTATLADGTRTSDTETLAWVVGDDVDPGTVTPGVGDEPSATPTATPTATETAGPPTATVTPSPSASPSESPQVSASASASAGSVPVVNGGSGESVVGGSLAATGSGSAVFAGGAAAVAVALGAGAVFVGRRRVRRTAS